jgi:rhodanese-related sulfurtransferase
MLSILRSFHTQRSMASFISAEELAEIIRSGKTPKKDYVVVDVRDDDYAGGNIVGCVNLPSRDFLNTVDQLAKETKDVPIVIFHCALSQMRGPKAARVYLETRQNVLGETNATSPTKVLILRDGFTGFQAKFKVKTCARKILVLILTFHQDDEKLVENWEDIWSSDWI